MTYIIAIGIVLLAVGIFMEMADYQKFSREFDKNLAEYEAFLASRPPPLPTSTV